MKTKPMRLRIDVTKEIIKEAMWCGTGEVPLNIASNCAIALAVNDIFPKAHIGAFSIKPLGWNCPDFKINLEPEITTFIRQFDSYSETPERRLELSPISFEIEIPEGLIDHINISDLERCKTVELVK